LEIIEKSNKVENFPNGSEPACVLIIRRSLVQVQPPPDLMFEGMLVEGVPVARVLSCAFRLAQARCTFRESDDFDSTGISKFG
jgi:hypothetical protein